MVSAAKKKLLRKKKRISKHILQAKDARAKAQNDDPESHIDGESDDNKGSIEGPTSGDSAPSSQSPAVIKPGRKQRVKDPKEASSYLALWKLVQSPGNTADGVSSGAKLWKYNKNMQSWLLRHMYENDKISKSTFEVLLDYLKGLQGQSTIQRVIQDAQRRAQRYKAFEKRENQTEQQNSANSESTDDSKETEKSTQVSETEDANSLLNADEKAHDAIRWKALADHEKRREYKRARKVLEVVKLQDK